MKSHEQKHVRRLVNQSADAYEDQWLAGFTPSIVDYLVEGVAPSFRLDLFESLLDLHIFYCDQKSIAIDFEQLKQQFPEFDDAIQDAKRRHDNDVSAASIETNKDDPQSAQSTGVSEVHDSFIDDMVAGKEFGRYRIIKRLGQGAMGVVFEAEDTALSRKVALKIPSLVDNQKKTIERFEREAQAAAGVRHPNVCQIFDVGCHDGKHFLTMELIQGESLDQVLKRSSPTPRQVAKLVSKLCLGIDELHRLGIVHRDLKPSNIMVNREGHPILMDFGLARQQGTTEATELTQPGMIVGSPAYMAPEQIKKSSDASPESDIYSLGIVMYQMLTGDLPFKGEMLDVLQQVMLNDPAAPSEIKPGIHPLLEKICLKAISKDPGDRFQDMAQFASELNHFLLKKPSEETEQRPASIVATACLLVWL
jgi:serine/threonine protein kinase